MIREIKMKRFLFIHSYTFPFVLISDSPGLSAIKDTGDLREKGEGQKGRKGERKIEGEKMSQNKP